MAPKITDRPDIDAPSGPGVRGTMGRLGPASFANPSTGVRRACELFGLMGDPNRLEILGLLAARERSVTELLAELPGMRSPSISHNLGLLRSGGLVDARAVGPLRIYSLTGSGRRLVGAATLLGS